MRLTFAGCMLLFTTACASPEAGEYTAPDRDLEFIEQAISHVDEMGSGIVGLQLWPMSRRFVIHPDFSPNAEALAAFARRAHDSGRPVHATVWIRDKTTPKNAPPGVGVQWPFIIVRLAHSPDPRAAGGPGRER